jgi:hypothetical protein
LESFTTNSEHEGATIQESPDNRIQQVLEKMVEAYSGHRIDEAFKHREAYLQLLQEKGA